MFWDTSVPFPDDKMVSGRDLGPAIDIGPVMTRKILKDNGQVIYRSTVRSLTDDEMSDEDMKKRQNDFDTKINNILGDPLNYEDLKDDPDLRDIETPSFDLYEDEDEGPPQTHIPDINKAHPNMHDRYVGAEVELSIGDSVMSGKSNAANVNTMGQSKARPMPIPFLILARTRSSSSMAKQPNTLRI